MRITTIEAGLAAGEERFVVHAINKIANDTVCESNKERMRVALGKFAHATEHAPEGPAVVVADPTPEELTEEQATAALVKAVKKTARTLADEKIAALVSQTGRGFMTTKVSKVGYAIYEQTLEEVLADVLELGGEKVPTA